MESVKKENERILRHQEELNHILIERLHTEGKGQRTESEDIGYQHQYKKTKQVKNESSASSEVYGDKHNSQYTSDSSEDNHHTRKRKYKPYEEFLESLRRSNRQHLMGKLKRGRKQNPGYPG